MRRLLHDGIPTRRGVMAIHEEAAYPGPHLDLENSEVAAREVLMLPLFADLSTDQQDYVLERLATHAVSLAS
jgi:dTDP-4-amino-4,6-dideoxygalactose transaminase